VAGSLGLPQLLCGSLAFFVLGIAVLDLVMSFLTGRDAGVTCPSCGKRIPENSAFCHHCGASVSGDSE